MADDPKEKPRTFSLRKLASVIKDSVSDRIRDLQRLIAAIISILSAVTTFFSAIFTAVFNVYEGITTLISYVVGFIRKVVHFDFKGCIMWVFTLPEESYRKCIEKTTKSVWIPVAHPLRRKLNRISCAFHAWLYEVAIYARGLRELSRRLFLLASDYTPGGKPTVTVFLVVISFIVVFKMLTVVGILLQTAQVVYSISSFLLHPLFLTLKDILSIFDPLVHILYTLVLIVVQAILSSFKALASFIWLNVVSISSGLHRCWQSFANSTIVTFVWKAMWSMLAKCSYLLSEKMVFVVLPFMTRVSYNLATLSLDISSVAYNNFFVVKVTVRDQFEYFNPTGLGSCILIVCAMLLAFIFRNTLSGTFFSEIDDKEYAIKKTLQTRDRNKNTRDRQVSTSRTSPKYHSSQRKATTNGDTSLRFRDWRKDKGVGVHHAPEDENDGHIHYSSVVPVCINYISGTCPQGHKCGNHHCPLPYHWQYRLPLEGWKSFNAQGNKMMEELFCDPENDIVTTSEIDVVVKSYTRERVEGSHRKDTVKVYFENMRIEKNYQRADLRRLSTESYVKKQAEKSISLGTQWLWYRKEESGEWVEYGVKGDSDAKQEDLESAFLRRDGNFTFTRDGQEFRLQFFMTPMCEKSFNPYSKKTVRRRPRFKSAEEIQQLTRGKATTTPWFSIRRLFWWRSVCQAK